MDRIQKTYIIFFGKEGFIQKKMFGQTATIVSPEVFLEQFTVIHKNGQLLMQQQNALVSKNNELTKANGFLQEQNFKMRNALIVTRGDIDEKTKHIQFADEMINKLSEDKVTLSQTNEKLGFTVDVLTRNNDSLQQQLVDMHRQLLESQELVKNLTHSKENEAVAETTRVAETAVADILVTGFQTLPLSNSSNSVIDHPIITVSAEAIPEQTLSGPETAVVSPIGRKIMVLWDYYRGKSKGTRYYSGVIINVKTIGKKQQYLIEYDDEKVQQWEKLYSRSYYFENDYRLPEETRLVTYEKEHKISKKVNSRVRNNVHPNEISKKRIKNL